MGQNTIAQVGTAPATVYTTTNGTNTPTLAWGSGQNRSVSDVLVLVVTAAATTSITPPSTPAGWTAGPAQPNGTSDNTWVGIFWKKAAGGDAVPSISVVTSGTTRCGFSLFELSGADQLAAIDVQGSASSGNTAATVSSITVTSSGNVPHTGDYAIAAFAREQGTAATMTWTHGTGYSNFSNDGTTSTRCHQAVDFLAGPTSGSTTSDAATLTSDASSLYSAVIAVFKSSVSVSSTDTGSGSDTQGPPLVSVSGTDTGRGFDQVQWGGDAGHGTETQSVTTSTPPTNVSSSDTGTGTDTQGPVGISALDTGSGSDTQQVTASLTGADTGTGTDAQGPVGIGVSDAGSGGESGQVSAASSSADTGSGTETQGPVGTASPDTGAGSEAQQVTASTTSSDTGLGTDTAGSPVIASADTGTGTETQQTKAQVSGSDTGTGTEAQTVPGNTQNLASSDTGSGAESQLVTAGTSSSDSGSGTDQTGTVRLAAADTGTGTETQSVTAQLAAGDTGTGGEATGPAGVASSDNGTGSEAQGSPPAQVSSSDTGSGTDSQSVNTGSGGTVPTLVSAGSVVQNGSPSFGQATGTGNTLIAWIVHNDSSGTSETISNGVTGWTRYGGNVAFGVSAIWVKFGSAASETAPQFSTGDASNISSMLAEYSGTGSTVDQNAAATGSGFPTSCQAPSPDAVIGDLIIGCAMFNGSNGSGTVTNTVTDSDGHGVTATSYVTNPSGGWYSDFFYGLTGSVLGASGDQISVSNTQVNSGTSALVTIVPGVSIRTVSDTDTGHGTEAWQNRVSSSDTGRGFDQVQWGGDAGHGTEAQSVTVASGPTHVFDSDAGTGLESQSVRFAVQEVASADAGTGLDAQAPAAVLAADAGSGTESQLAGSATAASADSAAGADTGVLGVGDADSGAGSGEAQRPLVLVRDADAATGSEQAFFEPTGAVLVVSSDTGRGQEGDTEGYADTDAATGLDTQGIPVVLIGDTDAGTGTDTQSLVIAVQAVTDTDSGTGTEAWATTLTWSVSDNGTGSDAGQLVYVPSDTDAGTAVETAAYQIDVFPFPPPWLYNSPGGGYRLVFRPGTPDERLVRVFHGYPHQAYAQARELLDKILYADSLNDVADADSGTGTGSSGPTATVVQYPVPQAAVKTSAAPQARLVMLVEQGSYAVSDADSGRGADVLAVTG